MFLVEADYALKYIDPDVNVAMPISQLGITAADVPNQYKYTLEGAVHPVHHVLVHNDGRAVDPGGGYVVGVDPRRDPGPELPGHSRYAGLSPLHRHGRAGHR